MQLLGPDFYANDTVHVARQLLGTYIVSLHKEIVTSGMIVETEAYGDHHDAASHAARGCTARTQSMFGAVGHAYVYFIYGNHYCLNVVARAPWCAAGAVLIRAIEPIEGIEVIKERRGQAASAKALYTLTNGPGKLAQALGITRHYDGSNIMHPHQLYIIAGQIIPDEQVLATPRIGISKAQELLWRFTVHRNPYVSRCR